MPEDIFEVFLREYAADEATSAEQREHASMFVAFIRQSLAKNKVTAYLAGDNSLMRESGQQLRLPGLGLTEATVASFAFAPVRQPAAPATWPHTTAFGPRTSQ